MASRTHLSINQMWRSIGRIEGGHSIRQVARWLKVSPSVISRLWKRFKITGDVVEASKSGRPRKTTTNQDRFMKILVRRNRKMTARSVVTELQTATGVKISTQTVRNRLHTVGLYARRPIRCVPLTLTHRMARKKWCLEHANWTNQQWSNVLFTDESRFSLENDSRRVRIWRTAGEQYLEECIQEKSAFGGGSIMVWGGISIDGRTELVILDSGTINGLSYRNKILQHHVTNYAGAIGNSFILMDDNARPHRARMCNEYLENNGIERMEWPAYSPDLNPIEHVWDMLGRRVAARITPPRSLSELPKALLEEWENLSQELINSLILGLNQRCHVCLSVKGGHIPY